MPGHFHGVAIDYDGTLTHNDRPDPDVLAALREARAAGRKLVLVTGRILSELRGVFPSVGEYFDLVVGENGAVLDDGSHARALAEPIPAELDRALIERGIPFRRGQVILATKCEHDALLFDEIRRFGLDCQLVRNRGELMVLPAGISKGTGILLGLGQLGLSRHGVIAIGDAENDLSLLEACELGAAVANAVDSLKAHADVVLAESAGAGVVALLRGALLRGEIRVEPRRWSVSLGTSPDGEPVRLPASQIDLLVTGGSGSGKSFAAGLVAEQLIELGYSICVLDPEGDHAPLGQLAGVVETGGREQIPVPERVARVLQQTQSSVVIDLSLAGPRERLDYMRRSLALLERQRAATGLPHWLVVEEAHATLAEDAPAESFDASQKGHCLVTFQPGQLPRRVLESLDFVLLVAGDKGIDRGVAEATCAATGLAFEALEPHLEALGFGQALLTRIGSHPELRPLVFRERGVPHVRHWHKYTRAQLSPERRFYFRRDGNALAAAGNLIEFHRELRHCGSEVLIHHARSADFSRWLAEVIGDAELAGAVRTLEARLREPLAHADPETVRGDLLAAIEARYAE